MSGYCKTDHCNSSFQIVFSIALTAVAALVMAGCNKGEAPLSMADQLSLAEQHAGDGEFQEAVAAYDAAIELEPDHAAAHYSRGLMYVKLAQNEKAIKDFDKAVELDDQFSDAYRTLAQLHLKLKNYEKAIESFSQLLKLKPKDAAAHTSRGLAYVATAKLDKAIADFGKAISLDPKNVVAWKSRAQAHVKLVHSGPALKDFTKVIALKPKDPQAYRQRGLLYSSKGDLVKATSDFDKVIKLNPKDSVILRKRGAAWLSRGNLARALADLSRAIELSGKDALALNDRGQVLSRQKDWDKAIKDFTAAIGLKKGFYEAYCGRGSAYVGKGDLKKAATDFETAIKLNGQDARGYFLRGDLAARSNVKSDIDKAIKDFDAAISRKADYVEAFVGRSRMRVKQAQWDLAIQDCNTALKLDPKNADAHLSRGIAFNGKHEYDKAIKDFDWIDEQKGRNAAPAVTRAEAFSHLSVSYYQKGEYMTAIDSAYFALLVKRDHFGAHNNRAVAYIARAQYDKAIRSLNLAIRYNPEFAEAYSNRGLAYASKNNLTRALADLNKAIELQPLLAIALQRRGYVYAAKGDFNNAIKDLNAAVLLNPRSADALSDRGYFFAIGRDMIRAMADLDKAVRMEPGYAKAYLRRGRAYLLQRNYDKAIENFNTAIRLRKGGAEGYSYRGFAYNGKRDYELALKDFNKAIELNSKLARAYYGRNLTYRKLQKKTEADADLKLASELDPLIAKANTSKKAKKAAAKKKKKKKDAEIPPRFLVKSKAVDPGKLSRALASAKRIDQLVAANYKKYKVTPNPKTTDAQFVRRIYLDITGTIPTYRETRAFLNSKLPNKRQQLIDQLLGSDGYSSHYFNYWADVLRYTDRLNVNVRGEPYRQWIKQSLAESKPWDKMVSEMLTAEGLIWKNPATGYLQRDAGMPLDNVNNTVRIFLGTRIGCAQCHDHPFDRWKQKEFYQMAAFTFGTLTSTGGSDRRYFKSGKDPNQRLRDEYYAIDQEEEDRRRRYYGMNRLIRQNLTIVNDRVSRKIRLPHDYAYDNAKPKQIIAPKVIFGTAPKIKAGEAPRMAFARWLTSKDNPRFALTIANRLWKQAFGLGQIEPVDDMKDDTVAENPELMKFLESEMKRLNFDMKEYLRILFNSETYQRQASVRQLNRGEPYHFPGPILRRMTAEQAWDSFLTLAVIKPYEYREYPSHFRTDALGVDLETISATDLLNVTGDMNKAVNTGRRAREKKYMYRGVLLARASELPSPTRPNHFLRIFGQSNRELISTSSRMGSVPQVLFMFNGPITHMLLVKGSVMHRNILAQKTIKGGVTAVFLAILNRHPDQDELQIASQEIRENGIHGYGNIVWSLINTREFLFVQ